MKICEKQVDLCRKCGSPPEIVHVGDNKQYRICKCSKCGWIPIKPNEACLTLRGAIRAWNKECRK